MGDYLAMAGRFNGDQLILLLEELAATRPQSPGWGVAHCHGTLVQVVRAGRVDEEEPGLDFSQLREIKSDLAVGHLAGEGEMASQPFLRRETVRSQAFCAPGRLLRPDAAAVGRRFTRTDDPGERFFLHVLESIDENDPIGSVAAMHDRLADEPDQRFMLLNAKRLIVSTRLGGGGEDSPEGSVTAPVLWLGRAAQVRVLAPCPLAAAGDMKWEPVPAGTVMVFGRQRYEAG